MKKKILFVASESAPGMIPFASTIINRLNQESIFEIQVLCVNRKELTFKGHIDDSIKCRHLELPNNLFNRFIMKIWPSSTIKNLESYIKEFNPDYIHLITGDFTLGLYTRFSKYRSKLCYTVHDLEPHEMAGATLYRQFVQKLITFGYKECRDNIALLTTSSRTQYETLCRLYPNKRIIYTRFPTLVDEKIKSGKIIVKELVQETDYILFFGTVNQYKGVDLLIDAYKHSQSYGKNKLVIAGTGLDFTSDSNIIRINRFINDEEVADLFKKSKLVIYPYTSVTMTGALSLAYYFDKPVILSDLQYFKDNMSKKTLLFKAGVEESLVNVLNRTDADYNSIIKVNDNTYDELYDDDKLVQDYHLLYE